MEPAYYRNFNGLLSISCDLSIYGSSIILALRFWRLLSWGGISSCYSPSCRRGGNHSLLRIHHARFTGRGLLWTACSHIRRMNVFWPLGIFALHLWILHVAKYTLRREGIGSLAKLLLLDKLRLLITSISGWSIQWNFKGWLAVTIFLTDSSSWEEIVINLGRCLWGDFIANKSALTTCNLLLNNCLLGLIIHIDVMALSFIRMAWHYWRSNCLLMIEYGWVFRCESFTIIAIDAHLSAEELIGSITR